MKLAKALEEGGGGRKLSFLAITVCALLSAPLSASAEVDIYGNQIKVVDGKTYQFLISGNPETAASEDSNTASSTSVALCTGTLSAPAAVAISLEARFRTWLESLGTALKSTRFRGFFIDVK